jgi:hypothetical protein
MTHGKVFIRSGFEGTLEVCNVTLQPSFPDCGRTLEAAKAITRQVRLLFFLFFNATFHCSST